MTTENKEGKEALSSFAEKCAKSVTEYDQMISGQFLISPTEEQYELLLQRLQQQLGEGRGEVILEVNILLFQYYYIFNIFFIYLFI